jgi:hypothetical protein
MTKNVGTVDRAVRVLLGVVLLSYAAIGSGSLRWWGLIGFVPLLTAIVRVCPAYLPFGINTCANKKNAA